MVKYGICYICAKNGLIAMKQEANISIEFYASDVTIGFDLGHDIDWIFKVKFGICYISAKDGLIATKWKVCI